MNSVRLTANSASNGRIDPATASAVIDLDAFAHNYRTIVDHVAPALAMAVIKGDAYGHGAVRCARAARDAGATWLGVATVGEALELREAGDTGRIVAWLHGPEEDMTPAVADDIDIAAGSVDQLSSALMAAAACERTARVHLEIDSGMRRAGADPADWEHLCQAAVECEQTGAVKIVGIWSHLATADDPGNPATDAQARVFTDAVATARGLGLDPEVVHLGNSAAALIHPELHHDMVRVGIALYGIDPNPDAPGITDDAPGIIGRSGLDLRPVMRLRAHLAAVRDAAPGDGVSYARTWVAEQPTRLGLVPLGYADGILRCAGNNAEVFVGGRRVPLVGRVCMDQFVVDLGPDAPDAVGDEVTLFGGAPAPSAEDWGRACGTIGYEIVSRLGSRIPRVLDDTDPGDGLHHG